MRRVWIAAVAMAGCARPSSPPPDPIVEEAVRGWMPAPIEGNHLSFLFRTNDAAYRKLVELCDDVGHRLSGSKGLERAVEWAVETLKKDGHENVRAEQAKVPKWVRGAESLTLVEPREMPLVMLGLGGSVGTPPEGITAEVLVVRNKEELDHLGGLARGKIVLFNFPMPPFDKEKGSRYGETVTYRSNGANWASKHGAVAALVRSVTAKSVRTPHTGAMNYGDAVVKIPAAAVTIEDAEMLARFQSRKKKAVVRLVMEAKTEGLADSHNVV